jgi:hypothetical protein
MFMITTTFLHKEDFYSGEELLEANKLAYEPWQAEWSEKLSKMIDDGILMNIGSVEVVLPNIIKFDQYCETQDQVDHFHNVSAPYTELFKTNKDFSISSVTTEIPSIPWEKTLLVCVVDGKSSWQPV